MSTGFEIEFDFESDDSEGKLPFEDKFNEIAKAFGLDK